MAGPLGDVTTLLTRSCTSWCCSSAEASSLLQQPSPPDDETEARAHVRQDRKGSRRSLCARNVLPRAAQGKLRLDAGRGIRVERSAGSNSLTSPPKSDTRPVFVRSLARAMGSARTAAHTGNSVSLVQPRVF